MVRTAALLYIDLLHLQIADARFCRYMGPIMDYVMGFAAPLGRTDASLLGGQCARVLFT